MIITIFLLFFHSTNRRSLKKSGKKSGLYSSPPDQQQYYDHDDYEDNSRFRPSSRQYEDSQYHPPSHRSEEHLGYRTSQRQTYDDTPHPLEEDYRSYSRNGSIRQNGQAYSNSIMEEDDEVVTATYTSPGQRKQIPSKLPPLEALSGKKKKKKKFLKRMAENSPRAYYDD